MDKPLDTRERLLEAAIDVFSEKGFDAAGVREICRRAGANVAAVNYHFGDKKRLYATIFDTAFRTLREQRPPFLPRNAPPEQRLEAYLHSFFHELFDCHTQAPQGSQLSAIYLSEMARPTDVLDRVVNEFVSEDLAELVDIVTLLLGPGADPLTAINCAASIAGQVLHYYHAQPLIERLLPDLPPPEQRLEELVRHVCQFSLGGIERLKDIPSGMTTGGQPK